MFMIIHFMLNIYSVKIYLLFHYYLVFIDIFIEPLFLYFRFSALLSFLLVFFIILVSFNFSTSTSTYLFQGKISKFQFYIYWGIILFQILYIFNSFSFI